MKVLTRRSKPTLKATRIVDSRHLQFAMESAAFMVGTVVAQSLDGSRHPDRGPSREVVQEVSFGSEQ
jgi:hypothetical protein